MVAAIELKFRRSVVGAAPLPGSGSASGEAAGAPSCPQLAQNERPCPRKEAGEATTQVAPALRPSTRSPRPGRVAFMGSDSPPSELQFLRNPLASLALTGAEDCPLLRTNSCYSRQP